jgi:hypothetical protein
MMKLWLFEAGNIDYDDFSEFVVAAETKDSAVELVKDRLYRQKVTDFKVREIVPALEMEGILCESFHAG